jgi:diguanylate cyclase (GGDEF)-like protein
VANVDELTGLLRRRAFFSKWEELLTECSKLNETCGVLMIDIDHFKKINDSHGHPVGDEVIKNVAQLLKNFESSNVVPARLGGEEFAVAIRGTEAEMLGVAEMIRRGAERIKSPVSCTVSVGMASSRMLNSQERYSSSQLIQTADQALYVAKKNGRNQVRSAA